MHSRGLGFLRRIGLPAFRGLCQLANLIEGPDEIASLFREGFGLPLVPIFGERTTRKAGGTPGACPIRCQVMGSSPLGRWHDPEP